MSDTAPAAPDQPTEPMDPAELPGQADDPNVDTPTPDSDPNYTPEPPGDQ